jgi:4-diphosphocytidyl-2-C-methyl-D-erythritol kinase
MNTQNTELALTLPSFAKINLVLRVLGALPDGYHKLETVFQTIEIHDLMKFVFVPSDRMEIHLQIDHPHVAADSSNLIHRACVAFDRICPVKARIFVAVRKRISPQSGLGGGSSNAATTLIAVSRYLGWPLNHQQLTEMASGLGADVPFFLRGGTALGTERGDRIQPLPDAAPYRVLLVHPDVVCSTAAIYRKFDENCALTARTNSIKILADQRPESQGDFVPLIENDLEKVVFALYPELDSIKKKLLGSGAAAAALTGSGSALFGLFAGDLETVAREFPAATKTRFVNRGEYAERLGLP